MPVTRNKTERPHGASLQPNIGFRYVMYRIGGRLGTVGVSSYTSAFALAETYVFVKQSLGPIFCVSLTGALFIPKLQSNFAEFLNKNYLARLWILSSPTCVRLRYGHHKIHLETFLGSVASPDLRRHTSRFCYADLPT